LALTLIEAAKVGSGTVYQRAVVTTFAQQTDILRTLPFSNIAGNALKYNQESVLPGVAFRGVNASYTPSTGVINPIVEPLVIAGGDLDVDKFIVDTEGPAARNIHEAMKLKHIGHLWTNAFLKGDQSADPTTLDGLQRRLVGSQLISQGSTSGGDPLSLAKLDQLIDTVEDPTHLIMSRAMRRRFYTASRAQTVGGHIVFTLNSMGTPVGSYAGLPLLVADGLGDVYSTLAFNEASAGGGTTGTSIYCVSFGEGKLHGIQNAIPSVRDLGELDATPAFRTRMEWYAGIALKHPRAAARLWGVSDAAIIA